MSTGVHLGGGIGVCREYNMEGVQCGGSTRGGSVWAGGSVGSVGGGLQEGFVGTVQDSTLDRVA